MRSNYSKIEKVDFDLNSGCYQKQIWKIVDLAFIENDIRVKKPNVVFESEEIQESFATGNEELVEDDRIGNNIVFYTTPEIKTQMKQVDLMQSPYPMDFDETHQTNMTEMQSVKNEYQNEPYV